MVHEIIGGLYYCKKKKFSILFLVMPTSKPSIGFQLAKSPNCIVSEDYVRIINHPYGPIKPMHNIIIFLGE